MDENQAFLDELFFEEDEEETSQVRRTVVTEQNFLEEYKNLQQIIATTDRADLDIFDQRTGKTVKFRQVRFSVGNGTKH